MVGGSDGGVGVMSYSIISGGCFVHASFHWK